MDEPKQKARWSSRKRWWPFALLWLILAGPLATGPISYGLSRGWVPRGFGTAVVETINRPLVLLGLQQHAESYQRWWGLQGTLANFDVMMEERRQREAWEPPPPAVMQKLRAGGFARVTLHDGTILEGYAGSMADDTEYVRVDGITVDNDGIMKRYGMRLLPKEIEAVEPLAAAPQVNLSDGTTVTMPSHFWPDSSLD